MPRTFSYCRHRQVCLLAFLLLYTVGLGASGLPELEFGPGLIDRLMAPETRLGAVREIVLAEDEARGKTDWKERPLDTFARYHQDIKLTRCPPPGGGAPLYLLTYQPNFAAISSRRAPEPQRHELLYPETNRERDAINRLVGSREAQKAAEPGVFWEPPAEPLEERVLVFLNAGGGWFGRSEATTLSTAGFCMM